MRNLAILASLAALVGMIGIAQAESLSRHCTALTNKDYLTIDDFLTKIIDHGYKVRRLETENGCGKIRVIDRNGESAELFVDLASGASANESAGHDN